VAELTTGTDLIDELLDGVFVGDNLVLQGDPGAPLELLVERFIASARTRLPTVVVTLTPPAELPAFVHTEGLRVLDWSPVRTGHPSSRPDALAREATIEDAIAALHAVEEAVGEGAAFVFDRLSAFQEAWDDAAALQLFLSACPRLYRRRSLALWPVTRAEHRPAFLRRLEEITQVVVELADAAEAPGEGDGAGGAVGLRVRKADGRSPGVIGRSLQARVSEGDLHAVGPITTSRERLGTAIRHQRLGHGLSQAEVARRVGITPSALSQVERGVRGPSGDTLVRLWEVLGVPFGPSDEDAHGYELSRRSGRERTALAAGLVAERLLDDPVAGQQWLVEVAPGAAGDATPFVTKETESVLVVRGVLDCTVEGRPETLHEGDALLLTRASLTGWANPGSVPAELVWTLHRSG